MYDLVYTSPYYLGTGEDDALALPDDKENILGITKESVKNLEVRKPPLL